MRELGQVDVRSEDDVVRAHQTTRTIAAQLGLSTFEQTRVATAMSEIARNALTYAGGGTVTLSVEGEPAALTIVVADRGPGIPEVDRVLAGLRPSPTGMGVGIPGARRLMDSLDIESSASGTRVEMRKRLPRHRRIDETQLRGILVQLAGQLADDPGQEIRRLLRDVGQRDQRIVELTTELEETNRGVIALQAELEDRAAYLQRAVDLRVRLLSEMGHELRTPLHSILSIAQFLDERLDGPLNEEQARQVSIIREIATTLTDYVNDLLDLARAEAGRVAVRATTFTAAGLLKALSRVTQPLARDPGTALVFADAAAVPPLHTDEAKVAQILRNLVANALKFTERGAVTVSARHEPARDEVVFEVRDTGVGVAPEHHELIFEEFAQVEGPLHGRAHGSGLGLPLSRRLAEVLGGTLRVEATAGAGSTFRLTLPRRVSGAAAPTPPPAEAPAVTVSPAAAHLRVLIIDDDEASRYVLRRWLDGRYDVIEAPSGAEGLRLAATERPDAIFLDVVMPDLSGFEVIDRLKAAPATRAIPVVVYSGLALGAGDRARLGAAVAVLRKSTSSRVADRAAVEAALLDAGIAVTREEPDV